MEEKYGTLSGQTDFPYFFARIVTNNENSMKRKKETETDVICVSWTCYFLRPVKHITGGVCCVQLEETNCINYIGVAVEAYDTRTGFTLSRIIRLPSTFLELQNRLLHNTVPSRRYHTVGFRTIGWRIL